MEIYITNSPQLACEKQKYGNANSLHHQRAPLDDEALLYPYWIWFHDSPSYVIMSYRGYYMATQRYEISLLMLKNISLVRCTSSLVKYFLTWEEKFCISKQQCNILSIILIPKLMPFKFCCESRNPKDCFERLDSLCNHSNSDLFTCEDTMFSRESSPGILLVFIQ